MPATDPVMANELPAGKQRGKQGTQVISMRARGVVAQPEHRWRERTADKPFLLEHDILRVRNVDNVAWEFRWDRRKYLIKAGEEGFVPFPAVKMMMGDPRSVPDARVKFNTEDGQRGQVLTRYEELCTLFAFYGIEQENIDALCEYAPKLEVHTMDDLLVTFPAQDPYMVAWPVPQVAQPGQEGSDTRRLIDNLQEDNAQMRAELDEMRGMLRDRVEKQGAPKGRADKATGTPAPSDDDEETTATLAAALAGGAPVDSGPNTQLG